VLAACGSAAGVSPTAVAPSASVSASPGVPVDSRLLSVLQQGWDGFKQRFIKPDGRVIDPKGGDITTSEAQSYGLLRSVWTHDRSTFDSVWHWTAANLQVRGDALFASLWGPGGVQDRNTATDADSDIALALLYASRRFVDRSYRGIALRVLADIWQRDVVSVAGMNVVAAGNWAATQQSPGPVINPSYFAPYAYRVFAREDTSHPWATLVDSSYTLLDRCTAATLDGLVSAGLPPNWCAISRTTGQITSFPQIQGANDYGYDAFRVTWRLAVDATWNKEQRAREYLTRNDFLRKRWSAAQRLDPVYSHDGRVVSSYDDPTVYGGDIGTFLVADPAAATAVQQHLMDSFHAGPPAHFGDPDNYYEQNWVWFGLALAGGALPDLDGG
jgi:endoglucanase